MLLIAGTVPIEDLPLTMGQVAAEDDNLVVAGHRIPCTQGTGAMVSAALATTDYLKLEAPHVLVAGDIGKGEGSRRIYEYLIKNVVELSPEVLALHYCLPVMALTKRVCDAVSKCVKRPVMIADAGSMYAAKAAGMADAFDMFTPDAVEMAFLADPNATHPAYISRHLFGTDVAQMPELVEDAYKNKGAAKFLLVKGSTDYVIGQGEILDTIAEPDVPVLEAIGGTGDTITGLVTAFVYGGLELHRAAVLAARANRMAGEYAQVTPATRIGEVVAQFPAVFSDNLCRWGGVCDAEGGNGND